MSAEESSPIRPNSPAKDWLRALRMTADIDRTPSRVLASVIDEVAVHRGDAPALLSDIEILSYRDLAERSRRYARWALEAGIAKGEVVGLFMRNRPEYMAIWLGLTSVGVVVALLNSEIRDRALAHCVAIARPGHIIAAAELAPDLAEVIDPGPKLWVHGRDPANGVRIDKLIAGVSALPLSDAERRSTTIHDLALLIYTSGSTGLPKAAKVSHRRLMAWSHWFAGLMDAKPADRMFDCLPMHHSVGGVVATGSVLVAGGSAVVAEKFSATTFWDDVGRWDCTLFQYIGELCRYLLAAPSGPTGRGRGLRLACGNGLRADVWQAFQDRFAIPRILEFYAATEGPVSLYNVEGRPGAVGRMPPFLAHRAEMAIVAYDHESSGARARCFGAVRSRAAWGAGCCAGQAARRPIIHGRPLRGLH